MMLPPLAPNAWLRWDVVQRLLPPDARTALEIGCGQGSMGTRLAARYDYLGVEPDPQSAARAAARLAELGRGELRPGLLDDVVEPGRDFDLVCAFEVLEHIEDDRAALASWWERVRPGGHLLLSVPAFQERFGPSDEMVGHYRRYSPEELTALVQAQGFVDVRPVLYGAPLGYALEKARNVIGARKLRRAAVEVPDEDQRRAELTSGSGRLFQPSNAVGLLTRAGTAPFRLAQRGLPRHGTGLVLRARRPS